MVSTRFFGLLSTVFLVVGALAVGQALHLTVVTGQVTYTSPAFVLQFVVGLVLIALGYRARRPIAESYDLTSDERDEGDAHSTGSDASAPTAANVDDGAEFDPTMSPLGEGAPGDAERERTENGGRGRDDRTQSRTTHDPTEPEPGETDSTTRDGRRKNGN